MFSGACEGTFNPFTYLDQYSVESVWMHLASISILRCTGVSEASARIARRVGESIPGRLETEMSGDVPYRRLHLASGEQSHSHKLALPLINASVTNHQLPMFEMSSLFSVNQNQSEIRFCSRLNWDYSQEDVHYYQVK